MTRITAEYVRTLMHTSMSNAVDVYDAITDAASNGADHVYISFSGFAPISTSLLFSTPIKGIMSETLRAELEANGFNVVQPKPDTVPGYYKVSW